MKCPNCGYFNLPNAQICGRCMRALTETNSSDAASSDEWLPPRASNRTLRQKLDISVSPFTRRAISSAENTADNVIQSVQQLPQNAQIAREDLNESARAQIKRTQIYKQLAQVEETWEEFFVRAGLVLLSIVPGLSQIISQRYRPALILSSGWILNALAFYLTIRSPISDGFLWCFGLIHLASIFENLSYQEDWLDERATLRAARYSFLSLGYIAVFAVAILSYTTNRFTPIQVTNPNYHLAYPNMGSPVVQNGDTLIFENFDFSRVQRGDLLIEEDNQFQVNTYEGGGTETADALWKVVGLPGDKLTSQGGVLFVNGKAVPKQWVPAFFIAPDGISKRVPMGELAVCGILYGYAIQPHTTTAPPSRFEILPYPKLTRRVLAIAGPPEHRQLFRQPNN